MNNPGQNRLLNEAPRAGVWVLVLSFMLALISQFLDPVINRDGMYYVDLSRAVASQGGTGAAGYDWPFLPLLLGHVSRWLSLDALLVAKAYAVICGALLPWLLFGVFRHYDRTHPALAALVALGLPFLAGYVDYITRDTGAWVAMMAAVRVSLQWREDGGLHGLVGIALLATLAFLFRTEMALLFLLLLYLPLERQRRRRGRWLASSQAVNATLAVLATVCLLPAAWFGLERVGIYRDAIARSPDMHTFPEFVERLSLQVNPFLADDMALVMAAGLLILVVVQLTSLLGVYILPLAVGIRAGSLRALVNRDGGITLLLAMAFVSVVVLFVFVMQFVVGRYLVPAALLLAPLVFLGMVRWYATDRRWPLTAFLVVAVLVAARGYLSADWGKLYLIDAGSWIAAHRTELAPVYYDDARVAFYAGDRYDPRTYKPLTGLPAETVRTLVLSYDSEAQLQSLLDGGNGITDGFSTLLHQVESGSGRGVVVLKR